MGQHTRDEALLKMLYLATMDVTANGQAESRTGARCCFSSPSFFRNGWVIICVKPQNPPRGIYAMYAFR